MSAATPAMPLAKPDILRILANTPAKIQHTTGMIASLLAMPSITASAYCFLSFAKKKGIKIAVKAGTQRAPSEMDCHTKVVIMIITIKIMNGRNETPAPP